MAYRRKAPAAQRDAIWTSVEGPQTAAPAVSPKSITGMPDINEAIQGTAVDLEALNRPVENPYSMMNNNVGSNSAFNPGNPGMPSSPSGPAPRAGGSGMYNEMTGLRGNKAFRNNNPGNITGMGGKLLYGAKAIAGSKHGDAGDRAQLVFANANDGWRAMNSLMSGSRYNNAPIASAFSKYQSDQNAWGNMKNHLRGSGINVDRLTFNQLSPSQKIVFMNQRARHEGFTGAALTQGVLG